MIGVALPPIEAGSVGAGRSSRKGRLTQRSARRSRDCLRGESRGTTRSVGGRHACKATHRQTDGESREPPVQRKQAIKDRAPTSVGCESLHVLHHASRDSIFGLGIIEELARHGYRLSAGTLYPILHGLEQEGYLRSFEQRSGRTSRRLYRATAKGRRALQEAKAKVQELFAELFEDR